MSYRFGCCTIAFLALLMGLLSCQPGKSTGVKTITIRSTVSLADASPCIMNSRLFSLNYFAADDRNNIYLTDIQYHRVLKYDGRGRFLRQIGSIGQSFGDLYAPIACWVKGDVLFILNDGGKEVSRFSLDGTALSSFEIKEAWLSDSLCVGDHYLFAGVKYSDPTNYNSLPLLTAFSEDGKKTADIGRLIQTSFRAGYINFNKIVLAVSGQTIFGAFIHQPIIFSYAFDGTERFYVSLDDIAIPQFEEKSKKAHDGTRDTPDVQKTDLSFRGVVYCEGFGVGPDMSIYYAINDYRRLPANERKHLILNIDKNGLLNEKLILRHKGRNIRTYGLYIDPRGIRYGIGSIQDENCFLFKF